MNLNYCKDCKFCDANGVCTHYPDAPTWGTACDLYAERGKANESN